MTSNPFAPNQGFVPESTRISYSRNASIASGIPTYPGKHLVMEAQILSHQVQTLIDDATSVNIISEEVARNLGLDISPPKCSILVTDFDGNRHCTLTRCASFPYNIGHHKDRLLVYIGPTPGYSLILGDQWQRKYNLSQADHAAGFLYLRSPECEQSGCAPRQHPAGLKCVVQTSDRTTHVRGMDPEEATRPWQPRPLAPDPAFSRGPTFSFTLPETESRHGVGAQSGSGVFNFANPFGARFESESEFRLPPARPLTNTVSMQAMLTRPPRYKMPPGWPTRPPNPGTSCRKCGDRAGFYALDRWFCQNIHCFYHPSNMKITDVFPGWKF
ncbi:hypothetical protein KEM56_003652 [Ascosphaera pollenicola]|nr:hypothetical protein KEM56_003652 [Ascosphaera pollenicola]